MNDEKLIQMAEDIAAIKMELRYLTESVIDRVAINRKLIYTLFGTLIPLVFSIAYGIVR